jgi:hypothetical protein
MGLDQPGRTRGPGGTSFDQQPNRVHRAFNQWHGGSNVLDDIEATAQQLKQFSRSLTAPAPVASVGLSNVEILILTLLIVVIIQSIMQQNEIGRLRDFIIDIKSRA